MKVICVGEPLLRLTAPHRELLLQSPTLAVFCGGAEANVAVSLARFGHDAALVGAVAANALGEAFAAELRRRGVDVRHLKRTPGRMGLYFLTPGAGLRPSEIIYDRGDSAFARLGAESFDWPQIFADVDWVHLSGITPALGQRLAELAHAALAAARSSGARVSFDCNYRPMLWQAWDGDAPAILTKLAALADLLFADERSLALLVPGGERLATGRDPFAELSTAALERFPNLARIATTTREDRAADEHLIGGRTADRDGVVTVEPRRIASTVDRIGSGDAFAAGLLHALASGRSAEDTLAFAVAAACLKHSIAGDANLATVADVEALLEGTGFGVRR